MLEKILTVLRVSLIAVGTFLMAIPSVGLVGLFMATIGFTFHNGALATWGMVLMTASAVAIAFGVAPFKAIAEYLNIQPLINNALAFPATVLFFASCWTVWIVRTSAWDSSFLTRIVLGLPFLVFVGAFAFGLQGQFHGAGVAIVKMLAKSLIVIVPATLVWTIIPPGLQAAGKRKLIRAQHHLIQESPEAVTFTTLAEYNQLVTDRFSPEDGTPQWMIGCANPLDDRLPRLFQRDPADAIHHDSLCGATLRPLTPSDDQDVQKALKAIEEERRKKQEAEHQEMERRVAEARAAAAMATPAPEPTSTTPPETLVPLPPDVVLAAERPPDISQIPSPSPTPKSQVPEMSPEERARRKEILRREYTRRYGRPDTVGEQRESRSGRSGYDYQKRGSRGREDADRSRDRDGDQINSRLVVDRPIKLAFTLDNELSTEYTRPGQRFRGHTTVAVVANSTTVINRGSVVTGEVEDVSPARDKRDHPTITLRVTRVDGRDVTSEPLVVTGDSAHGKQIGDVAKGAAIGIATGIAEKILRGKKSNEPILRDGAIGAGAGAVVASQRGIPILIIPTDRHLEVYLTE